MNELWVARDGNESLWMFVDGRPQWVISDREWISGQFPCCSVGTLHERLFPDLLPGQCRRLIMESEASE
jgi:hypothetical protein